MAANHSRRRRDPGVLEARRLEAAQLFAAGVSQAAVARQLGVVPSSANRWHQVWQEHQEAGLALRGPPGAKARLSAEQMQELEQLLLAGPLAAGYCSDLWTLPRIGKLIKARFGVKYHRSGVWFLLRRLGWSCQKPAKQAKERDEAAIQQWRERQWPAIKRGRRGAEPRSCSGTKQGFRSAPASIAPGRPKGRPRS